MRITLTVTSGPHKGKAFSFTEHDMFVVGRSDRANFQLPSKDAYFSRFHFLVEVAPPHCRLIDMRSTNGTYLNGRRISQADLHDGDRIRAGKTVLRVSVEEAEPSPDVSPASLPPPIAPEVRLTPPQAPAATPEVAPPKQAPAFGTLVPLRSEKSPPTPRREVAISSKPCLVCAAPASESMDSPASPDAPPHSLPLCTTCRGQIRKYPQPIPAYLVVRKLGQGTMGIVCLAVHVASATLVALKMIMPAVSGSKADLQRFLREARILQHLDHPNIVGFRDMGEVDGQLFFVMDYVAGTDADQLVKQRGPLAVGRAAALTCQILDALHYAHNKGFVHRDIKPANVLVTATAEVEKAVLADFGLARVYQASSLSGLTLKDEIGGTPAFIAPEQITDYRNVGPAVDQYAAAATLYNLLTARLIFDPPFSIDRALLMVLGEDPVAIQARRADLPKELADVVHRALRKDPKDRFANVGAMREALLPFQND